MLKQILNWITFFDLIKDKPLQEKIFNTTITTYEEEIN